MQFCTATGPETTHTELLDWSCETAASLDAAVAPHLVYAHPLPPPPLRDEAWQSALSSLLPELPPSVACRVAVLHAAGRKYEECLKVSAGCESTPLYGLCRVARRDTALIDEGCSVVGALTSQ